jgi:hypothetical protein
MSIPAAHRKYLLIETLISVIVNSLLSLFFAWVVFGKRENVDLWGPGGFAIDFLPQSFMVALMSMLVPGLLTRRRLRAGKIAPLQGLGLPMPRNMLLRALLMALLAVLVFGSLGVLLSSALWLGPVSVKTVLALKVIYGAVISAPITLVALRAELAQRALR